MGIVLFLQRGLNNPKAILGILVMLLLGWTHYLAIQHGEQTVQSKWNIEKIAAAKANAEYLEYANKESKVLRDKALEAQGVKNAELQKLNANANSIIAGLRLRTSRDSETGGTRSANAKSNSSCTGARLYKEDSTFLVRDAARADGIVAELRECQTKYNNAKDAIDNFFKEKH